MKLLHDIYKINYTQIPYGAKVVIYGAGHVGEVYVESVKRTGRLEIVAILDQKKIGYECGGITVRNPADISHLLYDYVLVAMEDIVNAKVVREELLSKGVFPEKIVWNGNEDKNELRSNQEYEKFLERNMLTNRKRIFLFMVPEHGNVGDYAIAYAEIDFLKHYFPEYEVITVTTLEWMNAKDAIISFVGQSDLIFLNGGGYLGDLWEGDIENYRSIVESFPNHKVVFFPNTLSFKNGILNNATFINEMEWFAKQSNVFVMLRDLMSFESFYKHNKGCMLTPDMVLFYGTKKEEKDNKEKEKINEVLVCLRNDREKLLDSDKRIIEGLKRGNVKFSELEINAERYISFSNGSQYVKKICSEMKKRNCVITDRLHGMLLAVLSNVPCIALDNRTHKVKGVLDWIKDKGYVIYYDDISNVDICSAVELAIYNKRNAGVFEFSTDEFDKMAKTIQKFIQ